VQAFIAFDSVLRGMSKLTPMELCKNFYQNPPRTGTLSFGRTIHIFNRPMENRIWPGMRAAKSPILFRESRTIFKDKNISGVKISLLFFVQIQKDQKFGCLLLYFKFF